MLKIACIDRTAALRLALLERIEAAIESARSSFGHLALGTAVPATLNELTVSEPPALVVFGDGLSVDQLITHSRELMRSFGSVRRIAILDDTNISLESLHLLDRLLHAYVANSDPQCRLVHLLYQQLSVQLPSPRGELIALCSGKGGVGTSSITAALAQSLGAFGRRTLVIDLSPQSTLLQYSLVTRWRSDELTTLLKQRELPRLDQLDSLTVTARNGITFLRAPSGGNDVRQLWLNSADHLELTLRLIDLLRDRFDHLLVDIGTTEGLLPFSLTSRADLILLVSSTEPAAMHLCHRALSQLLALPTTARFRVVINHIRRFGLDRADLRATLLQHDGFTEELFELPEIPFSGTGQFWMGSGNTLYTEGSRQIRHAVDAVARSIAKIEAPSEFMVARSPFAFRRPPKPPSPALLFELPRLAHESDTGGPISELSRVNGSRGSFQLELVLTVAATAVFAAAFFPALTATLDSLLRRFS